ncbi:MAG TPA: tryptophan synthase subunit alpha, partial [Nitrospiria bacterium]|nr:tryptophan synthase subunit alpha [Nitrospiria bacterium]
SLKNFSEIHRNVSHIKKLSRVPVAVGFGVSNPRNAARLAAMGDGVIVGSAIVRLIEKKGKHPRLPSLVGKFVRELNAAVKK